MTQTFVTLTDTAHRLIALVTRPEILLVTAAFIALDMTAVNLGQQSSTEPFTPRILAPLTTPQPTAPDAYLGS